MSISLPNCMQIWKIKSDREPSLESEAPQKVWGSFHLVYWVNVANVLVDLWVAREKRGGAKM